MTKQEWKARYPSFSIEEVYSPRALRRLNQTGQHIINFEFLDMLQALRNEVGPIYVNIGQHRRRGVRDPYDNYLIYNKNWNYSFHLAGIAADISSSKYSVDELYPKVKNFRFNNKRFTGIGLYPTWIHVDIRPRTEPGHVFWTG